MLALSKIAKKVRQPAKKRQQGLVMASFCTWDGATLILDILGEPNATRDAIGKAKGKQLQVSVTAAPVAGRATDHMLRFLAGEFGVPVEHIEVVFGRYNINKQLRIRSPQALPAVIANQLAAQEPLPPA